MTKAGGADDDDEDVLSTMTIGQEQPKAPVQVQVVMGGPVSPLF